MSCLICDNISDKRLDIGLHINGKLFYRIYWSRFQEGRRDKGLSQRALSAIIGIPQSRISKMENGYVNLQA